MEYKKVFIAFDKEHYNSNKIGELIKGDIPLLDLAMEWVNDGYADTWCEEDFVASLQSNDPDLTHELKHPEWYNWVVVTVPANSTYASLKK